MDKFSQIKESKGVIDVLVRFDTNTGEFELAIEECGKPTEVPVIAVVGLLESVKIGVAMNGYTG